MPSHPVCEIVARIRRMGAPAEPKPTPDYSDWDGYEDEEPEDEYEPGRWRNGGLARWSECLNAGTEFCDWECPSSRMGAEVGL